MSSGQNPARPRLVIGLHRGALITSATIQPGTLTVGSLHPFVAGQYNSAPGNENFLAAHIGGIRRGYAKGGWKLHVSAYPYNAQQVADSVLPVLYKEGIWHKYVKSSQLLNQMTGGQYGKFITIYTKDADAKAGPGEDSRRIVEMLKPVLKGLNGPWIDKEYWLAPMIYARYSYDYTSPNG